MHQVKFFELFPRRNGIKLPEISNQTLGFCQAVDALSEGKQVICLSTFERIRKDGDLIYTNFNELTIDRFVELYSDERFNLATDKRHPALWIPPKT